MSSSFAQSLLGAEERRAGSASLLIKSRLDPCLPAGSQGSDVRPAGCCEKSRICDCSPRSHQKPLRPRGSETRWACLPRAQTNRNLSGTSMLRCMWWRALWSSGAAECLEPSAQRYVLMFAHHFHFVQIMLWRPMAGWDVIAIVGRL